MQQLLVTGAFMTAFDDPNDMHMSPEELKVAIEEATRLNRPVMAHAHGAEGTPVTAEECVENLGRNQGCCQGRS